MERASARPEASSVRTVPAGGHAGARGLHQGLGQARAVAQLAQGGDQPVLFGQRGVHLTLLVEAQGDQPMAHGLGLGVLQAVELVEGRLQQGEAFCVVQPLEGRPGLLEQGLRQGLGGAAEPMRSGHGSTAGSTRGAH